MSSSCILTSRWHYIYLFTSKLGRTHILRSQQILLDLKYQNSATPRRTTPSHILPFNKFRMLRKILSFGVDLATFCATSNADDKNARLLLPINVGLDLGPVVSFRTL